MNHSSGPRMQYDHCNSCVLTAILTAFKMSGYDLAAIFETYAGRGRLMGRGITEVDMRRQAGQLAVDSCLSLLDAAVPRGTKSYCYALVNSRGGLLLKHRCSATMYCWILNGHANHWLLVR